MSRWTHSVCDACYSDRAADAGWRMPPHRVALVVAQQVPATVVSQPVIEGCCFCGNFHVSGIYVRHDPEGLRCGGVLGQVHREE